MKTYILFIVMPLIAFANPQKNQFEEFRIRPEMKEVAQGLSEYYKGNYKEAFKLFRKSCDKGIALGCFKLGDMYRKGEGIRKNYRKAVELYAKACNKNEKLGCYGLGDMYKKGWGVEQNYYKAAELFSKSCKLGFKGACKELGEMYEKGIGVKRDLKKAVELYSKACDKFLHNNSCERLRIIKETPSIFGLKIGFATEEKFKQTIKKKGWKINKSGYRIIKANITNPNIKGYIISGISLNKLDLAYFWFFKGTLFEVRYIFKEDMNKSTFQMYYDLLKNKYGVPQEYIEPYLADGKAVWKKGNTEIILYAPWANKFTYLIYQDVDLFLEAEVSDSAIYKREIKGKVKSIEGI